MVFKTIREKSTEKVKKIVYISFSVLAVIVGFILAFVPFCDFYTNPTNGKISAFSLFSLLGDGYSLAQSELMMGLIIFIVWILYFVVVLALLAKLLFRLARPSIKMKKTAKSLLVINTVATIVFFIGGIIFNVINNAQGGKTETASNLYPVIIMLVVDAIFAVYAGILQEYETEKIKENIETLQPKYRQLTRRKLEFLLFATGLAVCSVIAFLTNIINVQFSNNASYSFSLNGADLLLDYADAKEGGQVLAFVLLLSLTTVLSLYVVSLVSFLSKSNAFFRLTILSTIISTVFCFLVGMYGKYYEIIQEVNVEVVTSWIDIYFKSQGVNVNLSQYLQNSEITSSSFYFFLAAMGVCVALILRKPYSKGLKLENELGINPNVLEAEIDTSEIMLDQVTTSGGSASGQGGVGGVSEASVLADPCPAFSELDAMEGEFTEELEKKKEASLFEDASLPSLVQFIVQYARDSRLHLFYTAEDIAAFIAGLGTTKLTILQGMSGTGKTSLPKIFSEALMSNCEIIEVESSWRDKNELLGYYNEFSKTYTPKKFTQALYKAALNPETITFIVLDEMNLSRIEYYFSDFLSLMEHEPDKRVIKLLNVGLFKTEEGRRIAYKRLERGHTLRVLPNVWFIGTANRDESTFEISDKVYDRAHTMNFNKRASKVRSYQNPQEQRFLSATEFNSLVEKAKKDNEFSIENYPVIADVEKLLEPYNISFGNRIAMQIESFVAIYCACFAMTEDVVHDAVERILLSKVVSKLELKSIEDKEELAAEFMNLGLTRCGEFVLKLNGD